MIRTLRLFLTSGEVSHIPSVTCKYRGTSSVSI
jgi:hypothetical protein